MPGGMTAGSDWKTFTRPASLMSQFPNTNVTTVTTNPFKISTCYIMLHVTNGDKWIQIGHMEFHTFSAKVNGAGVCNVMVMDLGARAGPQIATSIGDSAMACDGMTFFVV